MCNCNNSYNNCGSSSQTTCHKCTPKPCVENTSCECPTILKSDCVTYSGDDLECSGVKNGTILTEALVLLDAFICQVREDLINAFTLKNIGLGAKIYKGVDLLGRKELRTITKSGDLIVIAENANDVEVTIDEDALNDFIEANQSVYLAENVGDGAQIYVEPQDPPVGDTTTFKFKTLVSNSLTITTTDEEVSIDTPMTASIPALYVNNLYEPSYPEWLAENTLQNAGIPVNGFIFRGKGTLAQPFTDNIVYPLAGGLATITSNTAIQNALDGDTAYNIPYSYVGAGTRLAPIRNGQEIVVQSNNTFYTFTGNFSYENLKLRMIGSVLATTSDYIVDMDNATYFDAQNGRFLITIEDGALFECSNSLGFRNSGNTSTTPPSYDTGRIGRLLGDGELHFSYDGVDNLTRYIFNGEGNANDGNLHFQIKCIVIADQQGIYLSKNRNGIDFYNLVQSGNLDGFGNIALKAFHMTGGQIRFFEKGAISLQNNVTGRTYGLTFEPEDDGIVYCSFALNSAKVIGVSENCFVKLNDENVQFSAFNSPSGDGFATMLVGTSTIVDGLFENLGITKWGINFKNNVFSYTGIDQTKVDLTQGNNVSTINFIGNSVLENLVIHDDRAAAISAGVALYSAYIKTNGNAYPSTATWVRDIVLPA